MRRSLFVAVLAAAAFTAACSSAPTSPTSGFKAKGASHDAITNPDSAAAAGRSGFTVGNG